MASLRCGSTRQSGQSRTHRAFSGLLAHCALTSALCEIENEVECSMDLSPLFEPRSVAIVGASPDTSRMGGGLMLKFLRQHGYRGAVYPVNPRYVDIDGMRCYKSLQELPEPIDLAVVAVPAEAVAKILAALEPGQVRVALLPTSGFGELGGHGRALEQELLAVARAGDIRLVGPNSVGSINLWLGLVPTISQLFDRVDLQPGELALVSQSGAFGTALLAQAEREGMRFGYFVSSGNEVDLNFADFANHLLEQENVRAICGYLECIRSGSSFIKMARRASETGKPVIVLKVGASETGAHAAQSHTGALVGSDAVAQAVFDNYNVVRADDGDHLMDLLKIFSKTPRSNGRRLAILSHSGGAGVMAADAAEAAGAQLVPLPKDVQAQLMDRLPPFAQVDNPLDMTGGASFQAKLMADCLRTLLASSAYDAAVLAVNLIWREGELLLKELSTIARETGKPFAVSWVAPDPRTAEGLLSAPFPVFSDPARAARALCRRLEFDARCRDMAAEKDAIPTAQRLSGAPLRVPETVAGQSRLLAAYGVRLPREVVAETLEAAEAFRREISGPVALKIASPDIGHRTEIGAVVVNVDSAEALNEAYLAIHRNVAKHSPDARIDGLLVQEMVRGGLEVLVGVKRDPVFGPIVAVGPGGTLVELIGELQMAPAPVAPAQARRMLRDSLLDKLLNGYRGGERLDVEALVAVLVRVSQLAAQYPEIEEMDLNPLLVLPEGDGCVAVDYKFRLNG